MSGFDLLPAIDVRDGRVVRLRQGDYAHETRYDDEPLALAQRYARMGARWLHLVDLDAARTGGYTLLPLLAAMKRTTGLRVQTGGGVRGEADVETLLAGGADRVVIGSLAVRAPEIVERCLQRFGPERITVALDAREVGGEWRLPAAGWTEDTGVRFDDLLPRYADAGLTHALCTDIGRDGMLAGPNLALYRSVRRQAPTVRLQASGGVRDVGDVIGARGAGCAGVVLGRALLEGRLDLVEGLREERPC